jgi:hypothetical protein
VLVLAISVGGGLLLYAMVRSEHDARTVTDRERGERLARRDTDDSGRDVDGGRE